MKLFELEFPKPKKNRTSMPLIVPKKNIAKQLDKIEDLDSFKNHTNELISFIAPYIKKHCNQAWNGVLNKNIIYRGQDGRNAMNFKNASKNNLYDKNPFLIKDMTNANRKSANTSNEYTMLIDILPSWKDWPKRSKSMICTTSRMTANGYGDNHVVLPFNNSIIGVCPAFDFWFSFKFLQKFQINGMDQFNPLLQDLFAFFGVKNPKNSQEMILVLNTLNKKINMSSEEKIKEFIDSKRYDGFKVNDLFKNKNIIKTLNDLMNPVFNNFKKINISKFASTKLNSSEDGLELFISGKAILISDEWFEQNKKALINALK